MLNVFICEDDEIYQEKLMKTISNTIVFEDFDMKLVMVTADPHELLAHVKANRGDGLYFLDVQLSDSKTDKLDGIRLAEKIRKYDPRGFVVFVTTHGEKLALTFKYKLEALDYIDKTTGNDKKIEKRIIDCVIAANAKYLGARTEMQKKLVATSLGRSYSFPFDELILIHTSSGRKLMIHSLNRRTEIKGSIALIEKTLDKRFFKCTQSSVCNLDMMLEYRDNERTLYLKNGHCCEVSLRNVKKLKKVLKTLAGKNKDPEVTEEDTAEKSTAQAT